MQNRVITQEWIRQYSEYLLREEKSLATREKYLRDVWGFYAFTEGQPITKELVMEYKQHCIDSRYAVRSINSMLAAVNSFLEFMERGECRVKNIRLQRQMFCSEETELSKAEYLRLLEASKANQRLNLILQTICATGIRVSELQYFTVEAVEQGRLVVSCKNKTRTILIPGKLRTLLLKYAKQKKTATGAIFTGRNGQPLDRSYIWRRMKQLCEAACVKASKVFPHNLRKLFARTFYNIEKDIAKLADVLGHSNINTTRIYIATTGLEHRRKLDRLGLIPWGAT